MTTVRLMAALALSLCSLPALAQSEHAQPHWHMIQVRHVSMMAADTHGVTDLGNGIRRVNAGIYLNVTQQKPNLPPVDFILMEEEIDCSTPGRYRVLKADGYQAHVREPSSSVRQENPNWSIVSSDADGFLLWKAVCDQPEPQTALTRFQTHEELLAHYRDFVLKHQ